MVIACTPLERSREDVPAPLALTRIYEARRGKHSTGIPLFPGGAADCCAVVGCDEAQLPEAIPRRPKEVHGSNTRDVGGFGHGAVIGIHIVGPGPLDQRCDVAV